MHIDLTGVWDDTLPRSGSVPPTTETTIHVPQLASVTIRLVVLTNTGARFRTALASSAKLKMAKSTVVPSVLVTKTGTVVPAAQEGEGRWDFTFAPTDLRGFPPGRYVFEVWVTLLDGTTSPVVGTSGFVLGASVGP